MTIFSQIWERLDRTARFGLVFCFLILTCIIIGLSIWLLRPDYQVLFGDLAPADAAAMTAELDRMKTPYRLGGGGNTILVPIEDVYKTRLKLVGRDLPLHGTVGFELFNNADIGMTEFAQKVNYQRALQGELTRTILSYEEIQAARVHLVLPEQSLFKKNNSQAKASVSLTLKPGKILQPHEVQGIQRLVAASVADILEEDVTVIDQHGVALTRQGGGDGVNADSSGANLDSKEAFERYLTRKVTDVLDRTFGAGQSIASVDVVFNRDAVKTTTENVLGANESSAAGVIVHEHQIAHEPPPDAQPGSQPHAATTNNRDVDYQVGRRVEQVVTAAGAIEKINVAVVVRQPLEESQIDRIRDIISMAAGIDKSRGDGIAVYTITQFGAAENTSLRAEVELHEQPATMPSAPAAVNDEHENRAPETAAISRAVIPVLLGLIVLFVLGLVLRNGIRKLASPAPLTRQERDELLTRVRLWLDAKPGRHGDAA